LATFTTLRLIARIVVVAAGAVHGGDGPGTKAAATGSGAVSKIVCSVAASGSAPSQRIRVSLLSAGLTAMSTSWAVRPVYVAVQLVEPGAS
jgi:hypothetical protein